VHGGRKARVTAESHASRWRRRQLKGRARTSEDMPMNLNRSLVCGLQYINS
jgi:hypothetical protein